MKNMTLFKSMAMTTVVALAMTGCGSEKKQPAPTDAEDDYEVQLAIDRDTTVYGLCGDGSAMNTLQLITDVGDTLMLSVAEARDKQQVLGGYSVGDRIAAILNADSTKATLVINESMMLGNWVMPNPLDGSDETGISLRDGGIVEGIEQGNTIFKNWRINNGMLEIVSQMEGGGDLEEVNLYHILFIGPDSLVLKDQNPEIRDPYEYSRQKKHDEKDLIKLEDSSFDDFRM